MEIAVDTDKIDFIRRRPFGLVITDALRFVKHNFWPLLQSIMLTAGIPALGSSLFIGVGFASNFGESALQAMGIWGGSSVWNSPWIKITGVTLLFFALALHNAGVSQFMVLYYERGPGKFTPTEVAKRSWRAVFTYALAQFLCYGMIGLSFMFCMLPALFVITMLSAVWLAIAFERKNALDAIGRSFSLVKQDWGNVLGLAIVLSILISYMDAIIQIPFTIISSIISVFTLREDMYGNQTATQSDLTLSAVIMVLSFFIVQLWFYVVASIYNVAMGLKYFDLLEKKESIAVRRDIELIGTPQIKTEEELY